MREEPDATTIDELIADHGLTSYNRRLADKIFNGFNQATAIGRTDVAEILEKVLRLCIAEEHEMRNAVLVEKAEAWRGFVEARNVYMQARESGGEQGAEIRAAMDAMRGAYTMWSRL